DVFLHEEIAEAPPAEVLLVVAGDLSSLRVREEQAPVLVEHEDYVGRALEEVRVALERAQATLGLESRDRDLLRLVPERLQHARVSERDGHRVRDCAAQPELALAELHRLTGAEEDDPHRAP